MRGEKINPEELSVAKIGEILKIEKVDLQLVAITELGDGLIVILGPMVDNGAAASLAFFHSVFNSKSQVMFKKSFPTVVVSLGKWQSQYLGKGNYYAWHFKKTDEKILERVKEARITDLGLDLFGETRGCEAVLHLYPDEDFGFTYLYIQDVKKSTAFDIKKEAAQLRGYWLVNQKEIGQEKGRILFTGTNNLNN